MKWINKKCYYFQKDGTMAKNAWIGTSYVDENGVWDTSKTTTSKTGWKQDKNGWWYVHADGSYTKNGWETIDGEKYYFVPPDIVILDGCILIKLIIISTSQPEF